MVSCRPRRVHMAQFLASNELLVRAIVSGVMFGVWPLVLSRSGLNGNVSTAIIAVIGLTIVSTFAVRDFDPVKFLESRWLLWLLAGVLAGCAIMIFNGGLAVAGDDVAMFFVVNLIMQITVTAIYDAFVKGPSASKIVGFILVGIAAYLFKR